MLNYTIREVQPRNLQRDGGIDLRQNCTSVSIHILQEVLSQTGMQLDPIVILEELFDTSNHSQIELTLSFLTK